MKLNSIRQLMTAATILMSTSCVAFDAENALSDEGCIIDVRPHAKPGPNVLSDDHWVVVEYQPLQEPLNEMNPQFGVVFYLDVYGGKYPTYVGTYKGNEAVKLPAGKNTIILEYKDDKILLRLLDKDGQPITKDPIVNDHDRPFPDPKQHIRWPIVTFKEEKKIVRVAINAYNFETGFTIHANDLLLKPKWKKYPKS